MVVILINVESVGKEALESYADLSLVGVRGSLNSSFHVSRLASTSMSTDEWRSFLVGVMKCVVCDGRKERWKVPVQRPVGTSSWRGSVLRFANYPGASSTTKPLQAESGRSFPSAGNLLEVETSFTLGYFEIFSLYEV